PEAKAIYDALVLRVVRISQSLTDWLQNGSLQRYLALLLGSMIVVGASGFFSGSNSAGARATLPISAPALVAWTLLLVSAVLLVFFHHRRLLALFLTSVMGLIVSLGFLYLSAPDLALTQISVEVVTIILLLLALN